MIDTQNSLSSEVVDALDEIAKGFKESENYKEYKNLEKIIEDKYAREIVMFNSAKEALEDARKYSSNLKSYEESLSKAKEVLYSKEEVTRYKELERIIQNELDILSNSIGEFFSNKFKKKRVL